MYFSKKQSNFEDEVNFVAADVYENIMRAKPSQYFQPKIVLLISIDRVFVGRNYRLILIKDKSLVD